MCEPRFDDPEMIGQITADILGALTRCRYFELLDDRLCPADPTQPRVRCAHSFATTICILRELGMDLYDLEEVMGFLRASGARCDCGVLYNVALESRLKAEYWKRRPAELEEPVGE